MRNESMVRKEYESASLACMALGWGHGCEDEPRQWVVTDR